MKDQEEKPEVLRDFDDILSVMAAEAGGVAFFKLLRFLRAIAKDDQLASIRLREMVGRFARLCRAATEGKLDGPK